MIRAKLWTAVLLAAGVGVFGCMPSNAIRDRNRELVFADASAPVSIDPAFTASDGEYPIEGQVYEQLTALDPAAPDGVQPALARAWRISPDGRQITLWLTLRHRFESGAPVDASAVKVSLDRLVAMGRGPSIFVAWLDHVDVEAPDRLVLFLKRPYGPALQLLSHPACSILDPTVISRHVVGGDHATGWLSSHSAGSGPYRLAELRPGESLRIETNTIALRRPAQFTSVRIMALPDEGVRRLLLERGDVDIMTNISAAFVKRYRELGNVKVQIAPGGIADSFLVLNTAKGPLRDVRLRQAVAAAIDYQGLREKVLGGNATQLPGFLTPDTPGFDPTEPRPRRDLALARRLVAASNYDGRPLRMLIQLPGPVAEFVQANLKQAGIDVVLERRSSGAVDALQRSGDFDLTYSAWSSDTPDSAPMLEALFTRAGLKAGTDPSGYSNPRVDVAVERALSANSRSERASAERDADLLIRADRPLVMLFSADPVVGYRSDISGVRLDRYRAGYVDFASLTRTPAAGRVSAVKPRAR